MTIRLHRGDLPDLARYRKSVAINAETLGLNPHRDRLCVVQLSPGDGTADVVQIAPGQTEAPNLKRLLADSAVVKIFHYARFDIAVLSNAFGVMPAPLYCTKIASRLTRTYTDRHGLKDLVRDLLGVDLLKAAAILRLGRRNAKRASGGLCCLGCAASACSEGETGRAAGARGPHRPCGGLFPFSARSGATRSPRLAGRGHFRSIRDPGLPCLGHILGDFQFAWGYYGPGLHKSGQDDPRAFDPMNRMLAGPED